MAGTLKRVCLLFCSLMASNCDCRILCFYCLNVQHLSECNNTNQCDNNMCMQRVDTVNGIQLISLGCALSETQCVRPTNTSLVTTGTPQIGDSTLLGRALDSTKIQCEECCDGPLCNKHLCIKDSVDGAWSDWGPWGSCSASCGSGSYSRSRTCSNPTPEHGGQLCQGESNQHTSCINKACPVTSEWNMWGSWSPCVQSDDVAGLGLATRMRNCNYSMHTDNTMCFCQGSNIEYKLCKLQDTKPKEPDITAFHVKMSNKNLDSIDDVYNSIDSQIYEGPVDINFFNIIYSKGISFPYIPFQFVAPVNGTYYFTFVTSLRAINVTTVPIVTIEHGSSRGQQMIASAKGGKTYDWITLSENAVTDLHIGDSINCKLLQGQVIFNENLTYFTGFQIQ